MKTRQFKQLAGLSRAQRDALVVEGLLAIGANVAAIGRELEASNDARSFRAARLLHNVWREEAGKFLILIDALPLSVCRPANARVSFMGEGSPVEVGLCADADYSIASQSELTGAIALHRSRSILDGPNDYD